jgi:ketosteroid isomerase-like protein
MRSDAFRAAAEAKDGAAVKECLAEDVRFLSPVVFRPYEGRELVATILAEGAMRVFEDFRYRHQLEDGDTATLIFEARVSERELEGLIRELTVMVRPMSGLNALAAAMGERFETLGITPPGG